MSLQYLYYLDQVCTDAIQMLESGTLQLILLLFRMTIQIGLSVSPLSNNFLFRKMHQNSFPKLFKRGLNVTLSTDDPLLFHMSDDALLEGEILNVRSDV